MKYKNAKKVLPESLLEQIQHYVQGEYIYIPSKNIVPRPLTDYGIETMKRDEHIYTKHLEGMKNIELAKKYSLSESSIRRIIINQRKRHAIFFLAYCRRKRHLILQMKNGLKC